MPKRIIYPTSVGIAIIIPTDELPVEVVARKDVPQGVAYKIVDTATVPTDRTFRSAWEADFTNPDGFGDPASYWAEKDAEAAVERAKLVEREEARKAAATTKTPQAPAPTVRYRASITNPSE